MFHISGWSFRELAAAPEQRAAVVRALTPLQQRAFKLLGVKPHPAPPAELLTAGAAQA